MLTGSEGRIPRSIIELKAGRGKTTDNQDLWIQKLQKQGYAALVAYGWQDAAEDLESYLVLKEGCLLWARK